MMSLSETNYVNIQHCKCATKNVKDDILLV